MMKPETMKKKEKRGNLRPLASTMLGKIEFSSVIRIAYQSQNEPFLFTNADFGRKDVQ